MQAYSPLFPSVCCGLVEATFKAELANGSRGPLRADVRKPVRQVRKHLLRNEVPALANQHIKLRLPRS